VWISRGDKQVYNDFRFKPLKLVWVDILTVTQTHAYTLQCNRL